MAAAEEKADAGGAAAKVDSAAAESDGGPVRALLIVDMQYDFMAGGSLEVPNAASALEKINELRTKYESAFSMVVCSQDWHPPDHCSFLSNNIERLPEAKVFEVVKLENGNMQTMWPDHCVQGSDGAKLHSDLIKRETDKIILKGMDPSVDSYSAFMDNDKKTKTAMEGLLKEHKVNEIYSVGLAYDYCVGWTAIDGANLGFKSYIVKDCSSGIADETVAERETEMAAAGVTIINLEDVAKLK